MTLHPNFVFSMLITVPFFALLAAERTEERKLEEQVLDAAREGATTTLLKLVPVPQLITCMIMCNSQHYMLSNILPRV